MQTQALTLSQFQTYIGNLIRTSRATQNVWIQAEFSDLRVVGGHCYMELIEKDAKGQTLAKIRAMIWSSTLSTLRRKFHQVTGRDIANGMKVMVCGSATHHNLYGLSFVINDINPDYTAGDLERQRREILAQLAREGVADKNRNLPIPVAPQRIAVISASGAAGYGDFTNQLQNNSEGFIFYPFLFEAAMQGERTAPTVIAALDMILETRQQWDVVVIIRGGGSTSDLNGFDNLELARRVATFPIPIAVGIGHERDRNVLDELACIRCKTPTAVAAWLIDNLRTAYATACDLVTRISRFGTAAMRGEHLRLASLQQALPALARARVMEKKMQLSQLSQALPALVKERLMRQNMILSTFASRIENGTSRQIKDASSKLQYIAQNLESNVKLLSNRETQRLQRFEDMLRILDPQNTLKRGYSITRVGGHAITDPASLANGTVIETTLAGGTIKSVVKKEENQD